MTIKNFDIKTEKSVIKDWNINENQKRATILLR